MKNQSLLGIITALALVGLAHGGTATNAGPDTLHYVTRVDLRNAASNAVASAKIDYNDSGNGVLQKFDLEITNLTKSASYSLIAVEGVDPEPVVVTAFTTDKKGKAKLSFIDLPNGGGSAGNTNRVLPALLNPLQSIKGVGIANAFGETVAFAWLGTAPEYAYSTKRNLTRVNPVGTEAGSIDLKASGLGANFKLKADCLTRNGVYRFVLNETVVLTVLADSKGRLQLVGWPYGAPLVPSLHLLELRDVNDFPVLSTTFGGN